MVVSRTVGATEEVAGTPQLVVIDLRYGTEEELMRGATSVAWSRDGTRAVYEVFRPDVPATELWISEDGGEPWLAVEGELASWSPDGRRLAFVGQGAAASRIGILEVANGELTHLGGRYGPLFWSPDGRHIAFESTTAAGEQVVQVIAVETGEVTIVPGRGPSWRPIWDDESASR